MFMFECPHCHTTIQARDQDRGSTAVCPQCGKGLVVPSLKKDSAEHAAGRHGSDASTVLDPRLAEPSTLFRVSKRFGSRREKRSGNNFLSLFPALLLTLLTISLFFWLERVLGEDGVFLQKFTHRGWTPYAALLLTYWALTILVWRFADILKKDSALEVAFLTPQSMPLSQRYGKWPPIRIWTRSVGEFTVPWSITERPGTFGRSPKFCRKSQTPTTTPWHLATRWFGSSYGLYPYSALSEP